jgi:hypothetical protein
MGDKTPQYRESEQQSAALQERTETTSPKGG